MNSANDARHVAEARGPTALLVAHPGHELRLSRWTTEVQPCVFVLTDGSRSGGESERVAASRSLLASLGATPGRVFGRHCDREVYGWVMAGDPRPFLALAHELAEDFVARGLRNLVVDGWQLYNVAHDLWHLTGRAAAALASRRLPSCVEVLDFEVVPQAMSTRRSGPARNTLRLSPAEVARKLELVAAYPEISGDVAEVLAAGDDGFLAFERLNLPPPAEALSPRPGEKAGYEAFGEARVRAGLYRDVLRWRHVEPIATALMDLIPAGEVTA